MTSTYNLLHLDASARTRSFSRTLSELVASDTVLKAWLDQLTFPRMSLPTTTTRRLRPRSRR